MQSEILFIRELKEEYRGWLDENKERVLAVLEDEKSSFLLGHPQVQRYKASHLKEAAWESVFLPYSFGDESARALMEEILLGVHLIASDYSDFGEKIFRNLKSNLLKIPHAKKGKDLFGQFTNIPAIICGSGPSLNLSGMHNKALIFAGGSTLKQVRPHFAAAIDPEAVIEHAALDVPFFYQNRVAPAMLSRMQGPLLWMPDSGLYPIERWANEQFNLFDPPFDGGWNVVTFLTSIAAKMGCNPILFTGVDFTEQEEFPDRKMAKLWLKEFIPHITFGGTLEKEWDLQEKIDNALSSLVPIGGNPQGVLEEMDKEELIYQKILVPLWDVWQYVFKRQKIEHPELNKQLFFMRVLQTLRSS